MNRIANWFRKRIPKNSRFRKVFDKILPKPDESVCPPKYEHERKLIALTIGNLNSQFSSMETLELPPASQAAWENFLKNLETALPAKGFLLLLREFQFTAGSLEKLRRAGLPPATLKKLAAIKGECFSYDENFLKSLRQALGDEEATLNLPAILAATEIISHDRDLMAGFEDLFKKIYEHLETLRRKAGTEQQAAIRALKKRLLKIWQPFSVQLEPALAAELVQLILQDGEKDPRWIVHCIPHLNKFAGAVSPAFSRDLRELVTVEAGDLSAGQAMQALKTVANSQLALLENEQYRWAHLNLARLLMTKDFLDQVFEEGKTIDDYLDWHLEQAARAEAELTNLDRVLAAYSRHLKKEYHRVIDLLEAIDEQEDRQLLARKQMLLANAYGELWLRRDQRGNAEESIRRLESLKAENKLTVADLYLLIRLLAGTNRLQEAKVEFERIDPAAIKADKADILDLAWAIRAFDKIEPFLEQALADEPQSTPLLSRLCELYRFHRNRFGEAKKLMARIADLDEAHAWVCVDHCALALDAGKTDSVQLLLKKLPDGEIWETEANIVKGRLALKAGQFEQAREFFNQISYAERLDYKFWLASLQAHEGEFARAFAAIGEIKDEPLFQEKVLSLRAQLLLAQERYEEALQILEQLPADPATNLHKAWACFHLQRHDEVLQIVAAEKNEEEIFLKAKVFDEKAAERDARRYYQRFLNMAHPENPYFADALERFTLLVIENEAAEDAGWLLDFPRLRSRVSQNRLAHLHILKKAWPEALQALLADDRAGDDQASLLHVYQQLAFGYIRDADWEKAEAALGKLQSLGENVEPYHRFVARARLIAKLKSADEAVDDKRHEEAADDALQIAMVLHGFLGHKISFEEVFAKIEAWAGQTAELPEPPMLLLILALLKNDKQKARLYAQSVLERAGRFADDGLRLVAKTLAAMVIDMKAIPTEDLLEILHRCEDKLPISAQSFWHKIILSVAQHNIKAAKALMDEANALIALKPEEKAALYAQSAFQHLKENQQLLALENLDKAM